MLEFFFKPKCSVIFESWPSSWLLSGMLLVPISVRSLSIHLTQWHLMVAIFSSILSLSWNNKYEPSLPVLLRVSSSFCALISRSLVKRPSLTYLIVYLRTGSSIIDLWTWSVSRLNFYSSSVFRQDVCPCL
jgi:hypothetical protein